MTQFKTSTAIQGVLFDLDGTLLDTAPDLAGALNLLLLENDQAPLPYQTIRPAASHGSAALLKVGFGLSGDEPAFKPLQQRYLELYQQHIADNSQWFAGVTELVAFCNQQQIPWGIITNKPEFLTFPLLKAMFEKSPLASQPACVICGDTAAKAKPDPAPMNMALQQIERSGEQCVYIGDAERDIQAGNVVNCISILAGWGYIGPEDSPASWGADLEFATPVQLQQWLEQQIAGSAGGSPAE